METFEAVWEEALAREHAHQRELLATLRDELGAFARECASALTALDALVGLAGVAGLIGSAKAAHQNAVVAHKIATRLPALIQTPTAAPEGDASPGLYAGFPAEGDLPPSLIHRADELMRAQPRRDDRDLLNAIVSSAGSRTALEQLFGPASVAALSALAPLAHWVPSITKLRRGDPAGHERLESARKDLTSILQSTAGAAGDALAADAVALAQSLQDTVAHVEKAARAVSEGRLEAALAEARTRLEADLDALRAVVDGAADAPVDWIAARRAEHEALTAEVQAKLAKVERIRRALGLILPHLQMTARALATVENIRSLEGRLDPGSAAGIHAARMSLMLSAADAWHAGAPESGSTAGAPPKPTVPKEWLAVAAAAIAAAAIGIAVAMSSGSNKSAAPASTGSSNSTTTTQPAPPAPTVSPVHSRFDPEQRATVYSIAVAAPNDGAPTYAWRLDPPKGNSGCDKFAPVPGAPNQAVWHHADTDGCTHNGIQHLGTVTVTVTTQHWTCVASFFGTLTATGNPAQRCTPV